MQHRLEEVVKDHNLDPDQTKILVENNNFVSSLTTKTQTGISIPSFDVERFVEAVRARTLKI